MRLLQRQTAADDILAVVFALRERLAGHIVLFVVFWRVKDQMIGAPGGLIDPASRQSPE
jgi:hypothetical protein